MTDRTREEVIEQRAAASAGDFMENGPRLWIGRESYVLARGEGKSLRGGLGAMGIGVMWTEDSEGTEDDPTWTEAPYDPDQLDHFGADGRATVLLARGDGKLLVENLFRRGETLWIDEYPTEPRTGALVVRYDPDRPDTSGATGRMPAS